MRLLPFLLYVWFNPCLAGSGNATVSDGALKEFKVGKSEPIIKNEEKSTASSVVAYGDYESEKDDHKRSGIVEKIEGAEDNSSYEGAVSSDGFPDEVFLSLRNITADGATAFRSFASRNDVFDLQASASDDLGVSDNEEFGGSLKSVEINLRALRDADHPQEIAQDLQATAHTPYKHAKIDTADLSDCALQGEWKPMGTAHGQLHQQIIVSGENSPQAEVLQSVGSYSVPSKTIPEWALNQVGGGFRQEYKGTYNVHKRKPSLGFVSRPGSQGYGSAFAANGIGVAPHQRHPQVSLPPGAYSGQPSTVKFGYKLSPPPVPSVVFGKRPGYWKLPKPPKVKFYHDKRKKPTGFSGGINLGFSNQVGHGSETTPFSSLSQVSGVKLPGPSISPANGAHEFESVAPLDLSHQGGSEEGHYFGNSVSVEGSSEKGTSHQEAHRGVAAGFLMSEPSTTLNSLGTATGENSPLLPASGQPVFATSFPVHESQSFSVNPTTTFGHLNYGGAFARPAENGNLDSSLLNVHLSEEVDDSNKDGALQTLRYVSHVPGDRLPSVNLVSEGSMPSVVADANSGATFSSGHGLQAHAPLDSSFSSTHVGQGLGHSYSGIAFSSSPTTPNHAFVVQKGLDDLSSSTFTCGKNHDHNTNYHTATFQVADHDHPSSVDVLRYQGDAAVLIQSGDAPFLDHPERKQYKTGEESEDTDASVSATKSELSSSAFLLAKEPTDQEAEKAEIEESKTTDEDEPEHHSYYHEITKVTKIPATSVGSVQYTYSQYETKPQSFTQNSVANHEEPDEEQPQIIREIEHLSNKFHLDLENPQKLFENSPPQELSYHREEDVRNFGHGSDPKDNPPSGISSYRSPEPLHPPSSSPPHFDRPNPEPKLNIFLGNYNKKGKYHVQEHGGERRKPLGEIFPPQKFPKQFHNPKPNFAVDRPKYGWRSPPKDPVLHQYKYALAHGHKLKKVKSHKKVVAPVLIRRPVPVIRVVQVSG